MQAQDALRLVRPEAPFAHARAAWQAQLASRQQRLQACAAQLKTELFGIDDVIDRVIDSVRAWYVLPQCISRPVIVCLWGLTGTGKTRLVRRLAQLLDFYDRFVEVQMDGFTNGTNTNSIADMLDDSDIDEGMPGILVLDEFQRFRTVNRKGDDVPNSRYKDVWLLLSDGRLPPSLGMLGSIETRLLDEQYDAEREDEDSDEGAEKSARPKKFRLSVWEARRLKSTLKLGEPLEEIMQWEAAHVRQLFVQFRQSQQSWETDYSRLLIFVCGNLDEMYEETAQRVQDCDTDADIFHRITRKLSIIDVKEALRERFKPEQIARLGNAHVIYPSLARSTYERLIADLCQRYVRDMARQTGVRFVLAPDVHAALYANSVFPTQGTRPLFSSVHSILSTVLVRAALWALESGADLARPCTLTLCAERKHLLAHAHSHDAKPLQGRFAVTLELERVKARANADFRALLAVHEAGHALLYCLLFGRAPQEVKINIASFEGGYNSFATLKARTRQNHLDMICTTLAGRAAEAWVFGEDACTTGAEGDLEQATEDAARHIRRYGFAQRLSRTDVTVEAGQDLNTDITPSNAAIEDLLQAQYRRCAELLRQHAQAFDAIVSALLEHGSITPPEMAALLQACGLPLPPAPDQPPGSGASGSSGDSSLVLEPFAQRLAAFRTATPK